MKRKNELSCDFNRASPHSNVWSILNNQKDFSKAFSGLFQTNRFFKGIKIVDHVLNKVKEKDVSVIITLLNSLKEQGLLGALAKQTDAHGNGFLHLAVLHHEPDALKAFEECLGDDILDMHLITNNKGFTAMQIAEAREEPQKLKLLLESALKATNKCLDEDAKPKNYTDAIIKFNVAPDSRLAKNLKMAFEAMDFFKNLKSSSHPCLNQLNNEEAKQVIDGVHNTKKELAEKGVISSEEYKDIILSKGYGNCGEYSRLTGYYLGTKLGYLENALLNYRYKDSCHIFVATNLSSKYDVNTPDTWGSSARLIYAGTPTTCGSITYGTRTDLSRVNPTVFLIEGTKIEGADPELWEKNYVMDCGTFKCGCSLETVYFLNGDHGFNIMDRAPDSSLNYIPSYGEHAVFIDSWGYSAYPAYVMQQPNNYYNIVIENRTYNFLAHTNPYVHSFKTLTNWTYNPAYYTHTYEDPDELSKKFVEEKAKKNQCFLNNPNSYPKLDKPEPTLETKLSKIAISPPIILENKNGLFNSFSPNELFEYTITLSLLQELVNKNQLITDETTQREELVNLAWIAAKHGHADTMTLLTKAGISLDMLDESGRTPAFIAAQNGYYEVIKALSGKADMTIPFVSSKNSLIDLASTKNEEIKSRMVALIKRKSDAGEKEEAISMTPYDIAWVMGHDDISKLLDEKVSYSPKMFSPPHARANEDENQSGYRPK